MSFVFSRRRFCTEKAFALGMGGVFFLFLFGYLAAYSAKTVYFSVDRTYYCVVKQTASESVAVWSETAYLDGGAGYVLETDGDSFVAMAVYSTKAQAESVAAALARRGTACSVLPLEIGVFRFVDRRRIALYEETKRCVFTALETAEVFYRLANGLSAGEFTQREAAALLRDGKKVLASLSSDCTGEETGRLLRECEKKCEEVLLDTIRSQDARYIQLQLICGIFSLQKVFSV